MRIAEVIGTVTLSRAHPALAAGRYRLVVPLSLDNLRGASDARAEALVAYDELSAGLGSLVGVSEGREASQPFYPEEKPIDAYAAAILDNLHIQR